MSDDTCALPPHARRALITLFALVSVLLVVVMVAVAPALAQTPAPASSHGGGEATLTIPDLGEITFSGVAGRTLLMLGLGVCVLGLLFGLVIFNQLKNLPVHASMREISELIYETCKTYLITQGKFILLLEVFIGTIIVIYFGFLQHFDAGAGVCANAGPIATRTTTSSTATMGKIVIGARRARGGRAQVTSFMLSTPGLGRLHRLIFAGHELAAQPTRRHQDCQWEMMPKRSKSQ